MIKDIVFDCCGCSACAIICPYDCLEIRRTEDGFNEPEIINNKCVECKLCEKVCPMINVKDIKRKKNKSYSGYSLNKEDRNSCSSGGVGFEIAKYLLTEDYKVCGVRYNKLNNSAEHYISNNVLELDNSKGSKYIQSNCFDAFNQILDGNKYVVFGTPCQIAGVKRLAKIKNIEEKFIFVDFFCHGVPSQLLWEKYIKEKIEINKIKSIDKIKFRDKINGWHNFTMSISSDNNIYYSQKDKDKDLFYQFFLGNKVLNKCCYKCNFRLDKSESDIRIGDMWGNKYSTDDLGISGILSFSEKGDKILREISKKVNIEKELFSDVCEGQMKCSLELFKNREKVLLDLKKSKSLKKIYIKYILSEKIKNKIVSIVKGKK